VTCPNSLDYTFPAFINPYAINFCKVVEIVVFFSRITGDIKIVIILATTDGDVIGTNYLIGWSRGKYAIVSKNNE